MRNEYQDGWSRWHDRTCIDSVVPSSNNGWIYTAYAKHLGLSIDKVLLHICFEQCWEGKPFRFHRTPNKAYPPMSRDEILGMVSLEMFPPVWLIRNHWQFCDLPGFKAKSLWDIDWLKALKAAWKIRNSHRNALWNEPDLWHLGFRLPPQDTWFVLKKFDCEPSFIHTLYFYISSYLTVKGKSNSGKLILWLKLKELQMEGSWLYQSVKWEKVFYGYFGPHHPFTQAAR